MLEIKFGAFLATLLIAIITTLGGLWIATRKPSWYTQERLSLFMALGAGLLLGIGFLEFLPYSMESGGRFAPVWMILGLLSVIFVETYVSPKLNFFEGRHCDHDHAKEHSEKDSHKHEHHHHFISHQAACSAVGCLVVCAFFDGFQMNTAFNLGSREGWLVSLGLLFHILPDGVLAASIALAGGMTKSKARGVTLLTGGTIVAGALVSVLADSLMGGVGYILPFATGVLIYITLIHLLPVGAKHKYGLQLMAAGVLVYTLLFFLNHPNGHTH